MNRSARRSGFRYQHAALLAVMTCAIGFSLASVAPAQGAIKLYLLGGQSNMAGVSPSAGLVEPFAEPQTDVPFFAGQAWRDLQPGFGSDGNNFGPELSFGRAMKDALPDEDIALVKFAIGGTNLASQWRPPSSDPFTDRPGGGRGGGRGGGENPTGGMLYEQFVDTVEAAIASIETLGLGSEYEIAGMIWMQGESDSQNARMTELYEENLTNFINDLRDELEAPDMPFVIGQITTAAAWTFGDDVRQAQLNVAGAVPNTAVFDTNDLSLLADAIHYDTPGMVILGDRFAQSMLTLVPAPGSLIFIVAGWGAINRRRRRAPLKHNTMREHVLQPVPREDPEESRRWHRLTELQMSS